MCHHSRGMRFMYGTKHHKENRLLSLKHSSWHWRHMTVMASQINSNSTYTVYTSVRSGLHQRKHRSSALLVLGEGNPPVIGWFPSQRTSIEDSVSMWGRHHMRLECHVGVNWVYGITHTYIARKGYSWIKTFVYWEVSVDKVPIHEGGW